MTKYLIALMMTFPMMVVAGGADSQAGPINGGVANRVASSNHASQNQNSRSNSYTSNHIDTSSRNYSNTDFSRSVGYAPSLQGYTSMLTCDSSVGVSVGFAGGSAGVAIPWQNDDCRVDHRAEMLARMGRVNMATELLCGEDVRILRASVRSQEPCWLEDEALLDELTDAEKAYYLSWKKGIQEKQDSIQQLREEMNTKLDNFHRINQMK